MTRWTVDGHRLRRDGAPWFLLGDTAWELFHRLTAEEAGEYLDARAAQGFNLVLAVALSEFDGLGTPDAYGNLPFHDRDPARPDEAFWAHVDTVVRRANAAGIVVGLLPCWGGYWYDEGDDGRTFFTPETAGAYARWLATRYRDDEVIWVNGGDRYVETATHRAAVDAVARGIRDVVGDRHLITFHPRGHESSSDRLPDAAWLDFDLIQSGHAGWTVPNYQLVAQDRARRPARPTLDAEPNYEDHPVMSPQWDPLPGQVFDDRDARRSAYHAVLAGACGHVYGCQSVWQMFDPDRPDPERAAPMNGAHRPWRQALELPGARQMTHLARFAADVDVLAWEPAQERIAYGAGFLGGHQRVLAHPDGTGLLAYAPHGRALHLDLAGLAAGPWTARWWDPRGGTWSEPCSDAYDGGGRVDVPHPFPGDDGVLWLTAR